MKLPEQSVWRVARDICNSCHSEQRQQLPRSVEDKYYRMALAAIRSVGRELS